MSGNLPTVAAKGRTVFDRTSLMNVFKFGGTKSTYFDFAFRIPLQKVPTSAAGLQPHTRHRQLFYNIDQRVSLLDMPLELFDAISKHLHPVSALALSSTCRTAATRLDRTLLLQSVLGDTLLHYKFQCLGERDRQVSLGRLACHYCERIHDISRFPIATSAWTWTLRDESRKCRAALAPVELFPGFRLFHSDLRELVKWSEANHVLDSAGRLSVNIMHVRKWIATPPNSSAITYIKKIFSVNEDYPSRQRLKSTGDMDGATSLGFTIHKPSNIVEAHVDYCMRLSSLERDTEGYNFKDTFAELMEERNRIVGCPHFGNKDESTRFINSVRGLVNMTNLTIKALRSSIALPNRIQKESLHACRSCSGRISLRVVRFYRGKDKTHHPTRLHLRVDKEIGPPDIADNILWVSQVALDQGITAP